MSGDRRSEMTGGEIIVEMLVRFGVDTMFGLPGDQTDLYDALFHRREIRHVLVRHEQAAAHMADAYARATGKVGVCDASIGPGATNLISGIAEAHLSGIPVVAIVSDVRSEWRGRECFQEIDQVGVFTPITKMAVTIDRAEDIPRLVAEAFEIATSGRPGPVLLSFPIDVLKDRSAFTDADLKVDPRFGQWPAARPVPPEDLLSAAVDALMSAERPIMLAGGGAVASGAMDEVRELAELLDVPVATTYMGKGILAEDHPLALGPFGAIGRPTTNEYVLEADVALTLGTRFTNVDTAAWRIPSPKTRLLQIDIEPTQVGRLLPAEVGMVGDVKATLQSMLAMLKAGSTSPGVSAQRDSVSHLTSTWRRTSGIESTTATDGDASPIHPLQVIRALRDAMAPDDVIICDSGYNQIWGGQYFEVRCPGGPT